MLRFTFSRMISVLLTAVGIMVGLTQAALGADWCAGAQSPAEVTICNSQNLVALDDQTSAAFARALGASNKRQAQKLKLAQRSWLKARNECGNDLQCLGQIYNTRLSQLGSNATQTSASTSPWCDKAQTPAEIAVCGHPDLLDMDNRLAQTYVQSLASASAEQKTTLRARQRAWLKNREDCRADVSCLERIYQAATSNIGMPLEQQPAVADQAPVGEAVISRVSFSFYASRPNGNFMDALVLGNNSYSHLPVLKTPENDVKAVSSAFMSKGIPVQQLLNAASKSELLSKVSSFESSTRRDLFVLYYAGHAVNINGKPAILFPSFDPGKVSTDGYVNLDEVINSIGRLGYKRIVVVFDACRDANIDVSQPSSTNPAEPKITSVDGQTLDLSHLRRAQYAIVFSASMGQPAIDTLDGVNSPFAKAFATNFMRSSSFLAGITQTRSDVARDTKGKQQPLLQLSFDGDISLQTGVLKKVSVDFDDPLKINISNHSNNVHEYVEKYSEDSKYELDYTVSEDKNCRPLPSAGAVGSFAVNYYFGCAERFYGLGPIAMPSTTLREENLFQSCYSAILTVDLNSDGNYEEITFSSDKYGGLVNIELNGVSANFYSNLGCNFDSIYMGDVDADGTNDLVVKYSSDGEFKNESMIILSGSKLLSGMAGIYMDSKADDTLKNTFKTNKWLGAVGGLAPIALFYDQTVQNILELKQGSLRYLTYEPTYGDEQNSCVDKTVEFKVDGTAHLDCGNAKFVISKFDSEHFNVRRF
jgi:uncharacterized protein